MLVRSIQTDESGIHASASRVPAASAAVVSAESCARTSRSTHRFGLAEKSSASSMTAVAIDVSATTTIGSIVSHAASSADANNGFRWPPTQRYTPEATRPITATPATMDRMNRRLGVFAGAATL